MPNYGTLGSLSGTLRAPPTSYLAVESQRAWSGAPSSHQRPLRVYTKVWAAPASTSSGSSTGPPWGAAQKLAPGRPESGRAGQEPVHLQSRVPRWRSTKGSSLCQGPSHSQQGAHTDATQGTRPRHRAGTPLLGRMAPGRVQGLHTSQQCTWGPPQSGPGSPALAQGPHPLPAVLGCLTQVRLSLHSLGPQQSGFVSSYS